VASAPLTLLILEATRLSLTYRLGAGMCIFLVAVAVAAPTREGVWIGTWCAFRLTEGMLPSAVVDGSPARAQVRSLHGGMRIECRSRRTRALLRTLSDVPRASTSGPGLLRVRPGGARAVLMLEPPAASLASERYGHWCDRVVTWLLAMECPAQVVTVLEHFDSQHAQAAFDDRAPRWRPTPLGEWERALVGRVAEQSVRFRHHVVLSPGLAGADGVPRSLVRGRADSGDDEAARVLDTAMRTAGALGLSATVADRDDLMALVSGSVVGASSSAVASGGVVQVGEEMQTTQTVLRLPPRVRPGVIVDALLRSRARGAVSLHILPVDPRVARRTLDRRAALQRYTAREGNDAVDNQVALADISATLASMAQRELQACRVALTCVLRGVRAAELSDSRVRLETLLAGSGFASAHITTPGFAGVLAAAPGCAPLRRSLLLTSDRAAAALLPALGTPFADHREPLLALSCETGAPLHLSVWSRPSYNVLILGSSGAGKSVASKTLLLRHLMRGASAIVIDPDSEYGPLMNAVGGRHFELGEDAVNPLTCFRGSIDTAAGMILPVLSVMAGDEKGFRDGRPIRRLADEDQAWLHGELADLLRSRSSAQGLRDPVISDLVAHLEQRSIDHVVTSRETERCRVVAARLRRFTQGHRGHVFDRVSTFAVGTQPVAIGLRSLGLSYAADLTPALALVITTVMSSLRDRKQPTVILIDEAHRVTADPDAGEVMAQLVRQGRKHAAGVWMCSQRVDDFIGTDLGRTLAATAHTKILLGAEEAAISGVREVFGLDADECSALNPMRPGRCVLISGAEHAIAEILPGPAILALADTTARALSASPQGGGR
jgi:hypothetical protein